MSPGPNEWSIHMLPHGQWEVRVSKQHVDRSGQRFGKWTLLRPFTEPAGGYNGRYLARCDCGFQAPRQLGPIIAGNSRMCANCSRAAAGRRIEADFATHCAKRAR